MISNTATITYQLHPAFQAKVNEWLTLCNQRGLQGRLTSGYRSSAEQKRLYAQGRSWLEVIRQVKKHGAGGSVTDAPPGESAHNWGLAVDFDGPSRDQMRAIAVQMGFGTVPGTWDPYHVEWPGWRAAMGL